VRARRLRSPHIKSPHIWTQLRARQSHKLIMPSQKIDPLQPLLLLHSFSPRIPIHPLMERSRDLPLRRLRLHAELPLTDGQPEGAVELGEDVEDGDEGGGFADYVKRPWEVGAFDLEVGCGGCSGGLEEGSLPRCRQSEITRSSTTALHSLFTKTTSDCTFIRLRPVRPQILRWIRT